MNTHVHYMIARQLGVELRRAAERAQLTSEVTVRRRRERERGPVIRPTARSGRTSPGDITALEAGRTSGSTR
jgi:hypothetical protein